LTLNLNDDVNCVSQSLCHSHFVPMELFNETSGLIA
jgi:hypothetical protein